MKVAALIGPTASGKSALALEIARNKGLWIFSIDSLAVYRHIDIVSAKPTAKEREGIRHFGIDELELPEPFHAGKLLSLYHQAQEEARQAGKGLLIVGGSSFYLKALIDGLSEGFVISDEASAKVRRLLGDLEAARELLAKVDPILAQRILPADRFRLGKALGYWLTYGRPLSEYYAKNPPVAQCDEIAIFHLCVDRSWLRERIALRTHQMIKAGAIDEVAWLEARYGRAPHAMKAIGIREILAYFDGEIKRDDLEGLITLHTAQLAKRQETFNRGQFRSIESGSADRLRIALSSFYDEEVRID
ncbi:MAG: tRNA (adenosine(37)-N6)-dimethylallyltransferase MiaA [Campylobacterales bacterium]